MVRTKRLVETLCAAVEEGRPHPLLERFEREYLPENPWPDEYGGRRFRGLCIPRGFERAFKRAAVLDVTVLGPGLASEILPSPFTRGACALTPRGLAPLHRRPSVLRELLQVEAKPLEQYPLQVLETLVLETFCRRGNCAGTVVEGAQDIRRREQDGYVLDARAWKRAEKHVVPPSLSREGAAGWVLQFCSLYGWMHDTRMLLRHRVEISPDFAVRHSKRTLARRLFREVPCLVY